MQTEASSMLFEALDALRATGSHVERTDEALDLYRIDGGPELTTGGVIALAFQAGLMVGDAPAQ